MWSGLSLVAAVTAVSPAEMTALVLEVAVNGTGSGAPVIVWRDASGDLHLPLATLRRHRIRTDGIARTTIEGEEHIGIASLTGARAALDGPTQRLSLSVPAALFEASRIEFAAEQGPMTPGGRGFLLNYEVAAEVGDGAPAIGGLFELGIFSGASFAQTTAIARWSRSGLSAVRLDSNWTYDDPLRMRSIRIGDTISRGGVGGAPLRIGGIQVARDFSVQPGFVTLPMPRVSGSSALPSVVELYVNESLVGSREVQPGPFTLGGAPITAGSGEIEVVVRNALGRETVVRQSYVASPHLLRAGLHDYSYEVGFLRRGYGTRSAGYGPLAASATHRAGVSDRLTLGAHAEASKQVQTAGISADIGLPGLGVAGVSAAASHSSAGDGAQIGVRLERKSSDLSFGVSAEFASAGFRNLGSDGRAPPARVVQAFAGLPTRFGSLGASYMLYDARGEDRDTEFLSVGASIPLRGLGSLQVGGRRSFRRASETAFHAFLTLPFGAATSANAGLHMEGGDVFASALIQRSVPVAEGWGYRAAIAVGNGTRIDGSLGFNADFGEFSGEVSYRDAKTGGRLVVGGALASVDGELFASRRLQEGFAVVSAGENANVRVYADHHLVGRTNRNGRAIVPRLRAFEKNEIRLELADLPLDTEVVAGSRTVRPYRRSGVAVRFSAERNRAATMQVEVQGLGWLPAGATVSVRGRDFVTAPGGQVYLAGLGDRNVVEARWSGRSCSFSLDLRDGDDPQPDLGVQQCRERV